MEVRTKNYRCREKKLPRSPNAAVDQFAPLSLELDVLAWIGPDCPARHVVPFPCSVCFGYFATAANTTMRLLFQLDISSRRRGLRDCPARL